MPKITIYGHSMTSFNMMTVEAGTNCPKGGDSGHGGRTVLRIHDDGASVITLRVDGQEIDQPKSIEIVVGGDSEAATFIEGLEFAVGILKSQHGLPVADYDSEEEIP